MRLDQFNPRGIALRKFMFDILDQKYLDYEDLIERTASFLVTDKDIMTFSKLISDVYELGYKKAIDDCREQLNQMGIAVSVKTKTPG